jgi:cell division septation protein DedD
MLLIGNYVLEEALSADMGRVRKAGFEPVVKPAARKKTSMNRLFVADFNDHSSAQSTLEKLKRYTSDAFIIEQGGRFSVYAGSYLQSESANSEKERLKAAGYVTTVRHSNIAIPSQSLSVGPFNSTKAADAALGRLKSAGIKAAFVQK